MIRFDLLGSTERNDYIHFVCSNFHGLHRPQKYFYDENFQMYGIGMLQEVDT